MSRLDDSCGQDMSEHPVIKNDRIWDEAQVEECSAAMHILGYFAFACLLLFALGVI